MNELQIRLTADIKGLQSAINKAKQTLKSFESETATDSEKSNVGFRRKIGLIEQLNAKAKQLKVSLSQATNEQQIASFNAQLEQTNIELARLNALGKSFSAPAVKSFDNLKRSAGAATGTAIAFSRIIQDAPFGIIGVANNLQSFGEQFAALGGKATTAGQRLSMFFSALITPANLAILAVSALTAAWQAYNLGVFDSLFKTESLNDRLKDLNESTKSATANAGVELIKLENLRSVIEDETLSRDKRLRAVNELIDTYPKLFTLADREKLLNGDLVTSYEILTKAIIAKAKASIGEQELPNLIKQKEVVDSQLQLRKQQLATEEALLENSSKLTSIQQTFTGSEYEQVSRRIKPLKEDVQELTLRQKELDISIKGYTQSIVSYANEYEKFIGGSTKGIKDVDKEVKNIFQTLSRNETDQVLRLFDILINFKDEVFNFNDFAKPITSLSSGAAETAGIFGKSLKEIKAELLLFEEALQSVGLTSDQVFQAIANGAGKGFNNLSDFILKLAETQQFFNDAVKALELGVENTIGDVAFAIGEALGSGGNALQAGGAALLAGLAQVLNQLGQMAIAAGITLEAVKRSLETLNPVLAVAAGVALVALAGFVSSQSKKIGGNIGGGAPSAGVGSTFTNRREFGGPVSKGRAYIVGERRPELFVPNTNGIIVPQLPSMDYSGASMAAGAMAVDVNIRGVSYGDDILFTVQQAQIRRGLR